MYECAVGNYTKRGAVQLEKRRHLGDLIVVFQNLKGDCKKEGDRLLSRMCCDRTRGNSFKLKEGKFRMDIRRKFFAQRAVRRWHGCPEKLWMPHSCSYSRSGWVGPWTA